MEDKMDAIDLLNDAKREADKIAAIGALLENTKIVTEPGGYPLSKEGVRGIVNTLLDIAQKIKETIDTVEAMIEGKDPEAEG